MYKGQNLVPKKFNLERALIPENEQYRMLILSHPSRHILYSYTGLPLFEKAKTVTKMTTEKLTKKTILYEKPRIDFHSNIHPNHKPLHLYPIW